MPTPGRAVRSFTRPVTLEKPAQVRVFSGTFPVAFSRNDFYFEVRFEGEKAR